MGRCIGPPGKVVVMKRYSVIQWATGVVGSASLRAVIDHPLLDLVGVKVYSDAKEGVDAGDLVGRAKTGVTATRDAQALLDRDADCVIYCPMPPNLDEVDALLRSGKHVITPVGWIYPYKQDPHSTEVISAACREGGVNFHPSGCNPGGIAERFPLTFTGWCNRIDRVSMLECGDCRAYSSPGVMMEIMCFGKTPEEAQNNPFKGFLSAGFFQSIDMVAAGLGCDVLTYQSTHEYSLANRPIDTDAGVVEEGTIALSHFRHSGTTVEGLEIVQEQIWYVDDLDQKRLQTKWDIPRKSGWRISIDGDPNLVIDVDFPPGLSVREHVAEGLSTTGYHLVNAVEMVCNATNPGIKTYLDLPMITARMGSHALPGTG